MQIRLPRSDVDSDRHLHRTKIETGGLPHRQHAAGSARGRNTWLDTQRSICSLRLFQLSGDPVINI